MSKTPRFYQIEDAIEARRRKKVLIRYPMGLGKSELATLTIWEPGVFDATPCLIASQNQSVPDWEDHLREEYPDARIAICAEQPPEVKRELLAGKYDVYVVNHLMLSVPRGKGGQKNFYHMPKVKSFVLDESHEKGVGRKARAWHGARQIADRAEIVLPMSGTPIRKQSDGLWAQLRLVDKSLSSYWRFVNEHCLTETTPWKVEILGSKDSMQQELASRSIYRTYPEVGLALPDVIPYHHRVRMTEQTRTLYDRLKKDLRDEYDQPVFSAGAALSKLRRLTAHDEYKRAKMASIIENLDSFVVFTWHRETAEMLAKELKAVAITGEKDGKSRNALAKASNRIVATIASMATSVDLSNHRDVIFYEESYEPGVMDNALARVARWRKGGGDEPIRCRYLFCEHSIDERIHNLQSGRAIDAAQVYSERNLIAQEIAARMLA